MSKRRIQSTLDNFIGGEDKKNKKTNWFEVRVGDKLDLVYKHDETLINSSDSKFPKPYKIAAFDLDDTLIKSKSGVKFSKGAKDWQFIYPCIPEKLKAISTDHLLVIISNQKGVKKGHVKVDDLEQKIDDIAEKLCLSLIVLFSTDDNIYRKPATGMWDYLKSSILNNELVDIQNSVYVGDATGRPANWAPGRKKDFSCSDRKFAENINITFKTPEEYFLNEPSTHFEYGCVNPREYLSNPAIAEYNIEQSKEQELVLIVGPPGSGKSTFAKTYFSSDKYVIINRDTLKTASKCLKIASSSLEFGKSVVIDNTNSSIKSRKEYIDFAIPKDIPIRCFLMDTPIDLCKHLNQLRFLSGKADNVPQVAYNIYKSGFVVPSTKEGIQIVTKVPFKPNFKTDEERQRFLMWT